MKQISTNNAPAALGPYSQAIRSGNLLFCSGQIPADPATGNIPDGVEAQAEQALTNVKNLIEAAGASIDNTVKTTVFIKDMNDFAALNKVYAELFGATKPARSCVEVARLPKDVLVEIECIAEG